MFVRHFAFLKCVDIRLLAGENWIECCSTRSNKFVIGFEQLGSPPIPYIQGEDHLILIMLALLYVD